MISFVIPTLNEESVLENTLLDLKKFTALPCEIIVSDGNSADKTIEIANRLADQVLVYKNAKRQTIGGGKNIGAQAAKYDLLVFVDADVTIPEPDKFFRTALAEFENDPKLLGLTVSLKVWPEMATWADNLFYGLGNQMHRLNNNILHKGGASGEFQMIKKAAFMELGGYNENLPIFEDGDMFMRLAKIGHTKILTDLHIWHTGRRPHKIGWPKLLWLWLGNAIYATWTGKTFTKEWKPIR